MVVGLVKWLGSDRCQIWCVTEPVIHCSQILENRFKNKLGFCSLFNVENITFYLSNISSFKFCFFYHIINHYLGGVTKRESKVVVRQLLEIPDSPVSDFRNFKYHLVA
jgi:hypothetical protein